MLRPFFATALLVLIGACAAKTAPPAPPAGPPPAASVLSAPMPMPVPVARRTASAPAASCNARPARAFAMQIPAGKLDPAILDRAILYHSNRARCRAGLRPLGADPALRAVATEHSRDMVRLGFFDHTSPVPGKTTIGDRLRLRGVPYRSAAENLATAKRLQIESGQPVYPLGQARCAYSLTPNGRRLPVRTYDSIAETLVTSWIESPGHRRNLMNPAFSRHGASGSIDPAGRLCETVNATQLFAG